MLVKDCMTRHPIMVGPETLAAEARHLMSENNIRHLPVAGDGKRLLGLITRQRLAVRPDDLSSLNVWEITRYLSKLRVDQVMIKMATHELHTIEADKTVERAARYMTEHKIGCLPVVEEGNIVIGILTEIDLLRSLQEMLGLPEPGVRVTVRMPNKKGQFALLTSTIAQYGWGIMGIGSFPSPRQPDSYDMVLKIPNVTVAEVQMALSQVPEQEIVDIREVV